MMPSADPDISNLTKAQLLDMADDMGISDLSPKSTKADIISAIEEVENEFKSEDDVE